MKLADWTFEDKYIFKYENGKKKKYLRRTTYVIKDIKTNETKRIKNQCLINYKKKHAIEDFKKHKLNKEEYQIVKVHVFSEC